MSTKAIPAVLLFAVIINFPTARAQSNNYTQTNLVSNVRGLALAVDSDLVHPWGMAGSPNQPFRIAANGKGRFKSYDATGAVQDPRGTIAVPAGVVVQANPTGVAANTTGLFVPNGSLSSPFLFATQQGTISGEYADGRGDILATTLLVEDHSSQGAEYTGLTVLTPDCCAPFLAATDFHRDSSRLSPPSSIRSASRGLSSIPIFRLATLRGTCRSLAVGFSSLTHCRMPHSTIPCPALATASSTNTISTGALCGDLFPMARSMFPPP